MGMRMAPQQKKKCVDPETVERLRDALRFWLIVAVSIVVLETLMSVTAVQIGALRMCVIWVTVLGALIGLGFLVWYKTDDWSFPLGSCVVLSCFLALVGGIVGGDFLAQVCSPLIPFPPSPPRLFQCREPFFPSLIRTHARTYADTQSHTRARARKHTHTHTGLLLSGHGRLGR